MTSNVARVYPFQTLLPADTTGLRVDSTAQAEQARAELDEALRLHLDL